jgi:RimJ/RimL family protein N-acetyltransferase
VITTRRFVLRPLTPDDATERYSRWFDDASFIVGAKSAHGVADLRAYIEARAGREDVLFLGIFTREAGAHIGTIKYEPVDRERRYAVMGIFIGEREWRGRGVAAEVITASALWLRERKGIDSIILGVDRENTAAIRAFGKIGFQREASDRIPPRDDGSFAMVWRMDNAVTGSENRK